MSARRSVITLFIVLASVTAAGIAHVSLKLGIIHHGYAITEETSERRRLEEQNRKLRLEISLLRHPGRIEALAAEKLRMTRPEPWQIRLVRAHSHPLARSALGRSSELAAADPRLGDSTSP
ncbi:MAG: cell division protein FtsL [Deltaproteobacteria bacterium]|nr:cell division protein FtsL [Deltaproteobacteria bacterium]